MLLGRPTDLIGSQMQMHYKIVFQLKALDDVVKDLRPGGWGSCTSGVARLRRHEAIMHEND